MNSKLGLAFTMIAAGMASASSSQTAENAWSRTTPIPTARFGACACVVEGKVYVIGGGGPLKRGHYLSTVEAYDPATGKWAKKANMPTARNGHAAAVADGKIYVLGGEPSAMASLDVVEAYDPANDSWTTKTPMPTKRTFHCASTVGRKIYVCCGVTAGVPNAAWNPDGLEVYEPTTDTWSKHGTIPTPRACAAACVVDGKIYVMGGFTGALTDNPALSTVEEYDPLGETWTRMTNMPTARLFLAACAVDGKIYAVGGGVYGGPTFATVEEYDPASDTWTARAPLNTPRQLLATATVGNRLYAIGGTVNWANWSGSSAVEKHSVGSGD